MKSAPLGRTRLLRRRLLRQVDGHKKRLVILKSQWTPFKIAFLGHYEILEALFYCC